MADEVEASATATELSVWEGMVYGLIQGLTEFLPVSSSGHLALAHRWQLGSLGEHELAFDVLMHAATLIAIFMAFWREICDILRPSQARRWPILLVAFLPAALVGLFAGEYISGLGKSLWILGGCYVYTAVLLVLAEHLASKDERPTMDLKDVSYRQAFIVGLAQIPALFPGVSRSGSAVAGGLIGGMGPAVAVSFSFMAGLPLIGGAAAKKALDGGFGALFAEIGWVPVGAAFITALLSGIAAIVLLKLVVGRRRLKWFAGYCLLLAIACLSVAALGG